MTALAGQKLVDTILGGSTKYLLNKTEDLVLSSLVGAKKESESNQIQTASGTARVLLSQGPVIGNPNLYLFKEYVPNIPLEKTTIAKTETPNKTEKCDHYREGGIDYYRDQKGNIYKGEFSNKNIVDKADYKYIPNAIGGKRDNPKIVTTTTVSSKIKTKTTTNTDVKVKPKVVNTNQNPPKVSDGILEYGEGGTNGNAIERENIERLQKSLEILGYLDTDNNYGYFWKKTLDAVNRYKNDKGIYNEEESKGVVGGYTFDQIHNDVAKKLFSAHGENSQIEQTLKSLEWISVTASTSNNNVKVPTISTLPNYSKMINVDSKIIDTSGAIKDKIEPMAPRKYLDIKSLTTGDIKFITTHQIFYEISTDQAIDLVRTLQVNGKVTGNDLKRMGIVDGNPYSGVKGWIYGINHLSPDTEADLLTKAYQLNQSGTSFEELDSEVRIQTLNEFGILFGIQGNLNEFNNLQERVVPEVEFNGCKWEEMSNGQKIINQSIKITQGAGNITGNRVFTSNDPYVGETANAIENRYPGKVVDVNKQVYKSDGNLLTDYDIELDNAIIQVKKGTGKGATTQAINTAASTTKEGIIYLPQQKSTAAVVKGLQNEGFKVFTSLDELLDYVGK